MGAELVGASQAVDTQVMGHTAHGPQLGSVSMPSWQRIAAHSLAATTALLIATPLRAIACLFSGGIIRGGAASPVNSFVSGLISIGEKGVQASAKVQGPLHS